MKERIECERLILESLTLEEMEELHSGRQNFLRESVLSEVIKIAIEKKIERMQQVTEDAHPWLNYWLIKEKAGGEGVGLIGSKYLPDEKGYVELGYVIAEEFRRRAYMFEAMEGFLDWLYDFPFCSGAILSIRSNNIPSIKLAEKCGFLHKGKQEIYEIYQYDFLD